MIPELGNFALIMALCLAFAQAILPMVGVYTHSQTKMAAARSTAFGQFVFVIIAYLCLTYSFITNDFSVTYVAENSNSHLPLIYRICAVWGAHEGSILLWCLILSFWTVMVALRSRSLPQEVSSRVISILGMISIGFLLFVLATSNPFVRLLPNIPIDGNDLNPLLQDPGFVIHPPMLYMGYVGFSVAFAFAISALLSGRLDAAWVLGM